ncbi:diaminopimelate epimerase [Flavobacteriaceae bacterium S356]|uniref:Diaminopimelate epimerase n=1 Tax=Asprobacillus argus TaxID=3076534 RepID=A0ABU3LIY2_9FLAO|nr:diaminopimelate epimerase [Flavobacteriaceae bacterium S356]
MILNFYKYQGAGNDFIFLDNRNGTFPKENKELIVHLCDRHFGIGADGLILIENHSETDFKMVYFNADSSQTMCGNGARCAVAFAKKLGIINESANFTAYDGPHYAEVNDDGTISLEMIDVDQIDVLEDHVFTNTGTLHHIEVVNNLENYPVVELGRKIRNEVYGAEGSNVNFIEQTNANTFLIRTYERGVEDETLACGTGVTAAAIAAHKIGKTTDTVVNLHAIGGNLQVSFDVTDGIYKNVVLTGPAQFVFQGTFNVS